MLEVEQFRYGADNLGYLVYDDAFAVAVDGGAPEAILSFLKARELKLLWVVNTHGHADHTCGNAELVRATGANFLGQTDILARRVLRIGNNDLQVLPTPGHSRDSVCFYAAPFLLTGDTLFNGTIGNCFSGDTRGFYESLRKLMSLPPETIIFAGHDYVATAMEFLRYLDPEETGIDGYLQACGFNRVCSIMRDELSINPYLRFDDERIIRVLAARDLPRGDSWERWLSLMSIE